MKRIIYCIIFAFLLFLTMSLCKKAENNHYEPGKGIKILTNGILIDGTGADSIVDVSIIIQDNLIISIEPDSTLTIPDEAKVIDLDKAYILPGFFNTHIHNGYNEANLKVWAAAGVTTVRDLGYLGSLSLQNVLALKNKLNKDNKNARLIGVGPLITTVGGYGSLGVSSVQDAINRVNYLIDNGADLIKIAIEDDLQGRTWPMLSMEEIKAITANARKNNKPVSAHISRHKHVEMAVEGGVNDLAHMAINYVPDSILNLVTENNIYWVPTLELWDGVSKMYSLTWDEIAIDNLKRFVLMGGKVALGTDFDGYVTQFEIGMPIKEMKLMQQAGMTNKQIIMAATINSAHVCGLEYQLGSIEAGKVADILIVRENPLINIDALLNVEMVIKNGEIII